MPRINRQNSRPRVIPEHRRIVEVQPGYEGDPGARSQMFFAYSVIATITAMVVTWSSTGEQILYQILDR